MIQQINIRIGSLLLVVFVIFLFGVIWILNSFPNERKIVPYNTSKLIEFADSIRNSNPDSAMYCYNQVVTELQNLEREKDKSHLLSLAHIGIANVYSEKGEYKLALKSDSIAFKIASRLNNEFAKSKALTIKGITLFRLGDYSKALDCYEKAMNLAVAIKDTAIQAKLFSNLAMVSFYQGDNQKTISGFRKALELGRQIKNESIVAGNYLNLAIVYSNLSKNDSVIAYTSFALESFIKINDKNGVLLCYQNLGNIYNDISDYGKAIEYFQLSIKLAMEMDDKSNTAKGYHNLAEVYSHLGDVVFATKLLFQSIKIKEHINDKLSIAKGYVAVGNLYFVQNDYTKALQYYKKSLVIFQELQNLNEIGNSYSNMASVYAGINKDDSVVICYNEAIRYYKQVDYIYGISNVYINLSEEYRINKNYAKAEELLLKALDFKQKTQDGEGSAIVNNHLANLYFLKSEDKPENIKITMLQKAEEASLKSYKTAKILGALPVMRDACNILKQIYKKQENYAEAYSYGEISQSLSDSILNKDKVQALTFAEARWNVEKKQHEIDNLENTQKLNEEIIKQKDTEAKQHKIIIGFIVLLFILTLISILIIALFIRKRRNVIYQRQLNNIAILRLQNIRNAISPHFVFNILNNIWAIIDDRENARSQFSNLTNLIRRSLIHTDQIAISLEEEIEFVKSFTELQKFRLDNELDVKWSIAPDVDFMSHVPGMILQIPVENAIKHALAPKPGNRELEITIHTDKEFLILVVADNGDGYYNSPSPHKGTGTGLKVLTKTMNILNEKNEKKMSYEVLNRNENGGKGTKVIIKIPLQYNYNLPGTTI